MGHPDRFPAGIELRAAQEARRENRHRGSRAANSTSTTARKCLEAFPRIREEQHHNSRGGDHVFHATATQADLRHRGRSIVVAAGPITTCTRRLERSSECV
eukprot:595865-Pyramimonas_sp.AAC.1